MTKCDKTRNGYGEHNMPANGPALNGAEALTETERKFPSSKPEAKETSGKQANRRQSAKKESTNTKGGERFFLAAPAVAAVLTASVDSQGNAPALGRECATEAEAIIQAFQNRLNFYKISEFLTRAEVDPSGNPVLRKEVVHSNHIPAS